MVDEFVGNFEPYDLVRIVADIVKHSCFSMISADVGAKACLPGSQKSRI